MCGIVGYVGKKSVVPVIIDGLRRLEYRGYDSAGIAVGDHGQGGLDVRRAEGKLRNLEEAIRNKPLEGTYGIGHTRWATHGRPTEENAHPHRDCTGKIVVVHNGIVENYLSLKKKLAEEGHKFTTETDTEIIAHLVEKYATSKNGSRPSLEEAVRQTVKQLSGVFALAVISTDEPNKIVAARNGPPAVIGLGNDEYFVASDVPAILHHTRDIFFLADGDMAVVTPRGVQLTDFDGKPVVRQIQHVTWDPIQAEKGGFKHFMLKEIYEQPSAVRETALGRVSQDTGHIFLDQMEITEAEFREAKSKGSKTVAICNVVGSMITREAAGTIDTHAGPEIGVASTKAFTAQLTALYLFALYLAQVRGAMTPEQAREAVQYLTKIPGKLEHQLTHEEDCEELAKQYVRSQDFL